MKVTQSCLTLSNPTDCSPPGSSVHGILQARILEWVAMSSSRDLPDPGIEPVSPVAPALQVDSLQLKHQGSPPVWISTIISWIVPVFLHIVFIFFCIRSELIFSLTDWTLPHGETSALNRRYYAWWGLPLWQDPTDSVPVFILKMAIHYCSNSQVQCWDRLLSQSWSLPQAICYK